MTFFQSLASLRVFHLPDDISDCYHERIGASLAEQKLRQFGKDGGNLARESNVQLGFFMLSAFVKGEVIH